MIFSSPEFENNDYIPTEYTCDGDDMSPPLEIDGVPENARSLALIVDDPDASGGDFVHWVVWNIDPYISTIDPDCGECIPMNSCCGKNSTGKNEYMGPCPPSGEHRYFFKLFALDEMLDLPESSTKKDLLEAMEGHIIDKTELIGLYKR